MRPSESRRQPSPRLTLGLIGLFAGLLAGLARASTTPPRDNVRVGAQFPIYKSGSREDSGGRRRQAAFLLALAHVNDKTDGLWDDLLPQTNLSVSFYDSKRDEGRAAINAFTMWSKFGAEVAVGPASSGPSKLSQQIFRLSDLSIPQVAYSATSDQLSDNAASPLFVRTPPTDVFQANVIAAMIKTQGWRFVCVLAGTDAYSAAGAQATISHISTLGLVLQQFVSFEAGTSSLKTEIAQLRDEDCRLVVLWAQTSDIATVAKEALAQDLASSSRNPVLWFISEIFLGTFEDVCGRGAGENREQLCADVFQGALLVTPNFGPGSTGYHRISQLWHAQTPRVGSPGRTDLAGCDDAVDASGKHIWQSDHDLDPATPKKCTAVNFSDYSEAEANAMSPESSGDGRISTYVPYSYDTAITVAKGLDSLFRSSAWQHGNVNWDSPSDRGESIYQHILNVTFDGFSGKVGFRKRDSTDKFEGDRDAETMTFFLWNYDGVAGSKFENIGEISADGTLKLSAGRAIAWPSGKKPDDRPNCVNADFDYMLHSCDAATSSIQLSLTHDSARCKGANTTESVPCLFTPFGSSVGIAVIVMCCTCGVIQLTGLAWLVLMWRRGNRVIRFSQPAFLTIFNVGLLLMGMSPILFLGPSTDGKCLGRVWFINLSITLIWAPLVVKMYRVWRLFENKKLEKRHGLQRGPMLRLALYLLLFETVLLVVMSAVPSMRSRMTSRNANELFSKWNDLEGEAVSGMCGSRGGSGNSWLAVQGVVHVGAVVFVAGLSYSVRNAPADFQESKWLGLIGMNVFSLGGVVGAVYFLMSADLPYNSLVLLQSLGTFVICLVALMLMHVPKYLQVVRGEAVPDQLGSKRGSTNSTSTGPKFAEQKYVTSLSSGGVGSGGSGADVSSSGPVEP